MLQRIAPYTALTLPSPVAERGIGIANILSAGRRYKVLIGMSCIACIVLGAVYLVLAEPIYVATTQVFISPEQRALSRTDLVGLVQLNSSQLESQVQLVKSERIIRYVVRTLDFVNNEELRPKRQMPGASPKVLESRIIKSFEARLDARRVGQSYVIEISFWAHNPETAVRAANAVTIAYIRSQLEDRLNVSNNTEILEGRINNLRSDIGRLDKAVHSGRIDVESFPSADGRVISSALLPLEKSWPSKALILGFSGLVGLLIGGAGAAIRAASDDRLLSIAQVEGEHGVPVIGTLPRVRGKAPHSALDYVSTNPLSSFSQNLRRIKKEIDMATHDGSIRCVGFASAMPGEGKSVVAANVAYACATVGLRTLLIDCDVSSRTLTYAFSDRSTITLADSIAGACETSRSANVISPNLAFLPMDHVGANADNPARIVQSSRMRDAIARFRAQYDIVIVDLPAMSAALDPRDLNPLLDAVVVVARLGATTNAALGDVIQKLNRPITKVIGVILNMYRA